jgi:hypothetical protein
VTAATVQQVEDVELGVTILTNDLDLRQRSELPEFDSAAIAELLEFPFRDGGHPAAELLDVRRLPFE